jgi:hypothetical protein
VKIISKITLIFYALLLLVVPLSAQNPQVVLQGPNTRQLAEGRTYQIKWMGYGIKTVSIVAEGVLTSIPDAPRGQFTEVLAQGIPASQGDLSWQTPYLDTLRFNIRIKGYDAAGRLVAEDSRGYIFRPAILRNRTANGIYIDLRDPTRQRIYRLAQNEVTNIYLTSGARTHIGLPKTMDSPEPHDHVGVYRVLQKIPMYWSNEYKVWMTHSMRFWKGHFIHGTYPSEYQYLGRPASSGCIRMDRTDAKQLYDMTPIGTRVEIFGNVSAGAK